MGTKLKLALGALAVVYVSGSLLAFASMAKKLERERTRVLLMGDQLEILKQAMRRGNFRFDPKRELADRRVDVEELPDPRECGLQPRQHCYVFSYAPPTKARRAQLEKYFSEWVLHGELALSTDEGGRLIDVGWTNP